MVYAANMVPPAQPANLIDSRQTEVHNASCTAQAERGLCSHST